MDGLLFVIDFEARRDQGSRSGENINSRSGPGRFQGLSLRPTLMFSARSIANENKNHIAGKTLRIPLITADPWPESGYLSASDQDMACYR